MRRIIHQHEKPKRKKKEEKKEGSKKKEGKKKKEKKRFSMKEVTQRRREAFWITIFSSESLSADARLFIINLNTQDSTQTER